MTKNEKVKTDQKITYGRSLDKLIKGTVDLSIGLFFFALCLSDSIMNLFDKAFGKGGVYDRASKRYDDKYTKKQRLK